MTTLNPDFRGADEVIVPPNAQTGWTDGTLSETEARKREQYGQERLENDMPVAMRGNTPPEPLKDVVAKFDEFQASKGRAPGSKDWSLLDEFVFSMVLLWLPQLIGSCVLSNTFRGWVSKLLWQITFLGMPFELLGRNQFTPNNLSFYVPFNYGAARRRANMRGGDGLFCEPMVETFLKDGVISCSTPKLLEILNRTGNNKERDFPEPQSTAFYREWGNWKYLDEVKQYADFTIKDFPYTTSADMLKDRLDYCGMSPICSMIAIRKVGTHRDGFAIHARNPNDQWAHNMCFHGYFFASDGQLFFRFSNESWGETHIYNVPFEEVDDWFKRRNVTCASMGLINGPMSVPMVA